MATILIVDELPGYRRVLSTLLGREGYQCLEAADGVEALERARIDRPDLVISDIHMPRMDGHELAFRLWTDPAIMRTPVIFYTADRHDPRDAVLVQQWGVAHVIARSADSDQILRAVEETLRLSLGRVPGSPPRLKAEGTDPQESEPPYDIPPTRPTEQASRPHEFGGSRLADPIAEVVWTSDSVGEQILYINPAYEAIWGRTWPSLRDDDSSRTDVIHPDDQTRAPNRPRLPRTPRRLQRRIPDCSAGSIDLVDLEPRDPHSGFAGADLQHH